MRRVTCLISPSFVVAAGAMAIVCASFLADGAAGSAFASAEGTNSISGRAFLTVGESSFVRSCYESGVWLIPATPRATESMERAFGKSAYADRRRLERLWDDDADLNAAQHASCDRAGLFRFEHVPDGRYFVFARIFWLMRWQRNGGGLLALAEVSGGATRDVLLTTHTP